MSTAQAIKQDQLGGKKPPRVKGGLPWVGNFIEFAKNPYEFMKRCRQECGDVAEFVLFGQRMVLLTGDKASEAFYRASDEQLDQSAAYKLMTPIFGEGVVFDAPINRKNEQLKMLMPALRDKPMRSYAGLITDEVEFMIKDWRESGCVEIGEFMKQLTIYTSSHCLLGKEFRYELNNDFTQIYHDLEGGVNALAYNFPNLPIPAFRRRDKARVKLQKLVTEIMEKRKAKREPSNDMFQVLIDAVYEDGTKATPYEITGMLIGAIFAGHHTSSGTAGWVLVEMLKHPQIMKEVVQEIDEIVGDKEVDFQTLRELPKLEAVIKEVLRLHPPLIMLLRKVNEALNVNGYTIPVGDLVVAAPPVTHRIPELFKDPEKFDPSRYNDERREDKNINAFQPFGGGKHKCSGNAFAIFQIKAIFAVLLRRYTFELADTPDKYVDDYTQTIVQLKCPANVRYRRRADVAVKAHSQHEEPALATTSAKCPFTGQTVATPAPAASKGAFRIEIDRQLCQGHAVCMGEAPELFFVDDKGILNVLNENPTAEWLEKAQRAEQYCPNLAIKIIKN